MSANSKDDDKIIESGHVNAFFLVSERYEQNANLIEQAISKLNLVDSSIEKIVISSEDSHPLNWLDVLQNRPLFHDRSVLIIRHILKTDIPQEVLNNLKNQLKNIPEWGYVFFICENEYGDSLVQKTHEGRLQNWLKWAKSSSLEILGCIQKKSGNLSNSITHFCKENNIKIEPGAVKYLAGLYKSNPDFVFSELDRMILSLDSGSKDKVITETYVKEDLIHLNTIDIFKFVDDVMQGNIKGVIAKIHLLDDPGLQIDAWIHTKFLPVLTKQIKLVWQALTGITKDVSRSDLSRLNDLFPDKPRLYQEASWMQDKIYYTAKTWDHEKVMHANDLLSRFDSKIKGIEESASTKDALVDLILGVTSLNIKKQ